jgi:hypothetical protein
VAWHSSRVALQMDGDKVFLGVRGVAELDLEVRNSLPTCGLCHEIVVAVRFLLFCLCPSLGASVTCFPHVLVQGTQTSSGGYKHAWCVTGATPPRRDDSDGDCDTSVTNTPESSGARTPAAVTAAGPSGVRTHGSTAATVGVIPRTGARGRKALNP